MNEKDSKSIYFLNFIIDPAIAHIQEDIVVLEKMSSKDNLSLGDIKLAHFDNSRISKLSGLINRISVINNKTLHTLFLSYLFNIIDVSGHCLSDNDFRGLFQKTIDDGSDLLSILDDLRMEYT